MMRDEELQSLIATSLDDSQMHPWDPADLARIANRRAWRARRRKLILAGLVAVGLAGCAGVVSAVYLGKDRGVTTASEPSASTKPRAEVRMRPGCLSGVSARLLSRASGPGQDEFPILTRTHVGHATRTEVEVTNDRPAAYSSRVVLGYLAVAKPGSKGGAGDPERMPADSMVRPENQLARSDPLVEIIPAGQRLSVTFRATKPGTYGVYFIARFAETSGALCDRAPAPPPGTPAGGGMTQKIGDIIVK